MGIQVDAFVDTHCHMFTLADIPLHAVLKRNIKHPLVILFGGVGAALKFKDFERFIMFFDSESIENVRQVVNEMDIALKSDALGNYKVDAQEKILTPLVMDFDANGKISKFEAQLKRLTEAATLHGQKYPGKKTKVLPFVGLDPRRIIYKRGMSGTLRPLNDVAAKVDRFLQKYAVVDSTTRRDLPNLQSGNVIGIKIYPPLGFNVLPQDPALQGHYLAIYQRLAELDIPITAHCQTASFDLSDGDKDRFTTPVNWQGVLQNNATLANLRINLGHFGGDEGAKFAVHWMEDYTNNTVRYASKGISRQGWTTQIIKLLKKYPHTYSDISALNFNDEQSVASLLWLLAYDKVGKFDEPNTPNYPIIDKLMWGSDYPMILDGEFKDYPKYYRGFVNTVINRTKFRARSEYPPPQENELYASATMLKKLICKNPVKFLF